MSWQQATADRRCQGLVGADACETVIRAGQAYRVLASGRVVWCAACAARKLGETAPDTISAPAPAAGRLVLPARWQKFTAPRAVDGRMLRAEGRNA